MNTVVQRELAVSYSKLGWVCFQAGREHEARAHYEQGLPICETLVAADPTNASAQLRLSGAHSRLGDAFLLAGHVTEAREHHQKSL
jgi:hypothetical protein